jgi:hypothetical protein
MNRARLNTQPSGRLLLSALVLLSAAACGDSGSDPVGIDLELVVGSYDLAALRFDPQGSLSEVDILPVLGQDNVQLILTSSRTAQVVYQDPISGLFTTIPGSFRTTEAGIRLEFAQNATYQQLLLSRRMDLVLTGTTLALDGAAPDGVSRARLLELVPAFEGEQLLDPTPGALVVSFTR